MENHKIHTDLDINMYCIQYLYTKQNDNTNIMLDAIFSCEYEEKKNRINNNLYLLVVGHNNTVVSTRW